MSIGEPITPITPITEPIVYEPLMIIDPPITPVERYECAFPPIQRDWVRNRDGDYSNMPMFDGHGNLVGFDKTKGKHLEIHHIQPESWYKRTYGEQGAKKYMHNPMNGITLDRASHAVIHREWMQPYITEYEAMPPSYMRSATLQDYVKWQVEQGRPFWLTDYDKLFVVIATVRTVQHAERTQTFPFDDRYMDQAIAWYTRIHNSDDRMTQDLLVLLED